MKRTTVLLLAISWVAAGQTSNFNVMSDMYYNPDTGQLVVWAETLTDYTLSQYYSAQVGFVLYKNNQTSIPCNGANFGFSYASVGCSVPAADDDQFELATDHGIQTAPRVNESGNYEFVESFDFSGFLPISDNGVPTFRSIVIELIPRVPVVLGAAYELVVIARRLQTRIAWPSSVGFSGTFSQGSAPCPAGLAGWDRRVALQFLDRSGSSFTSAFPITVRDELVPTTTNDLLVTGVQTGSISGITNSWLDSFVICSPACPSSNGRTVSIQKWFGGPRPLGQYRVDYLCNSILWEGY